MESVLIVKYNTNTIQIISSKMLETLQNKHGERYHQDIAVMENRYQSSFGPSMMGDCRWTDGTGTRREKKHNSKAFLNILRTPVKIGNHINRLQDEGTEMCTEM